MHKHNNKGNISSKKKKSLWNDHPCPNGSTNAVLWKHLFRGRKWKHSNNYTLACLCGNPSKAISCYSIYFKWFLHLLIELFTLKFEFWHSKRASRSYFSLWVCFFFNIAEILVICCVYILLIVFSRNFGSCTHQFYGKLICCTVFTLYYVIIVFYNRWPYLTFAHHKFIIMMKYFMTYKHICISVLFSIQYFVGGYFCW